MANTGRRSRPEGIIARHRRHCASTAGASCDCRPSYQAQAYSPRDRKTIRRTFASLAEARAWRTETKAALRAGTLRAPTRTTISEAAETWLVAAQAGVVRTRSGEPYKPSALRAYEQVLRATVVPKLGHLRLSAVATQLAAASAVAFCASPRRTEPRASGGACRFDRGRSSARSLV